MSLLANVQLTASDLLELGPDPSGCLSFAFFLGTTLFTTQLEGNIRFLPLFEKTNGHCLKADYYMHPAFL